MVKYFQRCIQCVLWARSGSIAIEKGSAFVQFERFYKHYLLTFS